MEGNHTTRYSNEQFSGQFSDQTIEETLMQKAKSNGGLTRGRMRNENSVKVCMGWHIFTSQTSRGPDGGNDWWQAEQEDSQRPWSKAYGK